MRLAVLPAAAALALSPGLAAAQDRIDPASVTAPDVSLPKDKAAAQALIDNGWKYFFFHKQGVTFDTALDDITLCYRYIPAVALLQLPARNEWDKGVPYKPDYSRAFSMYGLVGVGIGAMIQGTMDRRDRQSRTRRCMETRGYTRYPMAEETWETLSKQDPKTAIPILAKLASGPKPDLPEPQK